LITLDTSGLFSVLNRTDEGHERTKAALAADPGQFLLPAAILGEVAYMIERWLHPDVLRTFVADLIAGAYELECGEHDFPRIDELIRRYDDLPLSFVDAAVIACAERHGGRVLTLDLRHFGVVAREGRITIVP
jgi:predicted nucleic acid-binding protein